MYSEALNNSGEYQWCRGGAWKNRQKIKESIETIKILDRLFRFVEIDWIKVTEETNQSLENELGEFKICNKSADPAEQVFRQDPQKV